MGTQAGRSKVTSEPLKKLEPNRTKPDNPACRTPRTETLVEPPGLAALRREDPVLAAIPLVPDVPSLQGCSRLGDVSDTYTLMAVLFHDVTRSTELHLCFHLTVSLTPRNTGPCRHSLTC